MSPHYRDPLTGRDVSLDGARGQIEPVRDVRPEPPPKRPELSPALRRYLEAVRDDGDAFGVSTGKTRSAAQWRGLVVMDADRRCGRALTPAGRAALEGERRTDGNS